MTFSGLQGQSPVATFQLRFFEHLWSKLTKFQLTQRVAGYTSAIAELLVNAVAAISTVTLSIKAQCFVNKSHTFHSFPSNYQKSVN